MTATDQLIDELTADLRPSRSGAAARRLAVGILVGAALSLGAIAAWLGQPVAAVQYTGVPAFAMKLSFSAAMAAAAGALLYLSGRPGHDPGKRLLWLAAPPALIAVTAIMEMSVMAPQFRQEAWLGSTWQTCLAAIILLSLPVLLGVAWAFKRLVPTRLRLAGFLAGATAGSTAAVVYALYCPETTATFLVSWYTLGIVGAALIGLLLGPRLLRW